MKDPVIDLVGDDLLPPWIIVLHTGTCSEGDGKPGLCDIVPAGQSGVVMIGVPESLAKALCDAANNWCVAKIVNNRSGNLERMHSVLDKMEAMFREPSD